MKDKDVCLWLAQGTGQSELAVCADEGDCTNAKHSSIAFIVASKGANFNRQLETPSDQDSDSNDLEARLYSWSTSADYYTTSPDPDRSTDHFDDIIEYVTADELLQRVNCDILVQNDTGDTLCAGPTDREVDNGNDLGVLNNNRSVIIKATSDNCATTSDACTISFADAVAADTDGDGQTRLTSGPVRLHACRY